jgi:hypothetical protein
MATPRYAALREAIHCNAWQLFKGFISYMATKAYSTRNALLREAPRSAATWPPDWMASSKGSTDLKANDPPSDVPSRDSCPEKPTETTNRPPVWPPRPTELATWPLSLRERWGVHAAELEILGTPFPESERRAYEHVRALLIARRESQIAAPSCNA